MVKHRSLNKGFTLFEIVIALGVLAIGILGVLALFPVGLDSQKKAIDYSMLSTFAQWKTNEIVYGAAQSGADNTLNQASEYPIGAPDPEPFPHNNRYFWHYSVSLPHIGILDDLYRVDLVIYSLETDPIGSFTSYVEIPKDI